MKVCALLSGGKDSVYTLHAAVVEGHLPVALASLVPPRGQDELDSFMYQTVGSSGLATLADALDLPLVTHTITGTARNQRAEYGSREGTAATTTADDQGDETEDLYDLLVKVKLAHPDVKAITVGAILSNYQRVRVEHVCARLGLVPLAYLWERDQKDLLADMVDADIESILVKVAGAGLGVQHLGKTLAQMQPTLLKLNKIYDTHPCGEGGEYETFTLDAPLFLRRVQLDATTLVTSVPDPNATVAHWHLDALSLSPLKPTYAGAEHGAARWERARELCRASVRVPRVEGVETREWERRGRRAYARAGKGREREWVQVAQGEGQGGSAVPAEARRRVAVGVGPGASEVAGAQGSSTCATRDGWLYVSDVVATPSRRGEAVEIEDEVRACFEVLVDLLGSHGATLLSLAHLTVYLSTTSSASSSSTMSLFPRINAVYASYFGTSPPTRACVEVPSGGEGKGAWRVKLEGVARLPGAGAGASEERKALHVQGLSYWAPANIGPYSQSVLTANRLFVAGQIPLLPSTLALPLAPPSSSPSSSDHGFSHAAALAMQHAHRIADASLPALAGGERRRKEAGVLWLAPVEGDDEWRRRVEAGAAVWRAAAAAAPEDVEEADDQQSEAEADPEHGSDDEADEDLDDESVPPLVVVEAAALPRGAPVEWQVTYCGGGTRVVDWEGAESSDEEGEDRAGERAADERRWDEDGRCVRMETVSNTTALPVVYHRSPATPLISSNPSAHDARGSALAVLACSLDEHDPHPLPGLARHDVAQVRAFYRHEVGSATQVRALAQRVLGIKLGADEDEAAAPALSLVPAGWLAVLAQAGAVEEAEVVFVLVGAVE